MGSDNVRRPAVTHQPNPAMEGDRKPLVSTDKLEQRLASPTSASTSPSRPGTASKSSTHEEERPPLPPRPSAIELLSPGQRTPSTSGLQVPKISPRPHLQSTPSTALSLTDIQTQSYADGSRETYAHSAKSTPSRRSLRTASPSGNHRSYNGCEIGDSVSIRSYAPTTGNGGDVESLLGDVFITNQKSPAWQLLNENADQKRPLGLITEQDSLEGFEQEFDEIGEIDLNGKNEEKLLHEWKAKRKHYLILSAAGKPIYNRHGSDSLISGYIGVIQTIISFFEGSDDQLRGFNAGGARFVVLSRGPLYLVAISKLGESDSQLRVQLEALYMQILSTLTLPTLSNLFSKRPSTDLRRPLGGTEPLLSALADTFTRGSPPALLSALECLKIRKSHRQSINNSMLKARCSDLLYGLIVAGGRLVSVIRPRTHSLHPGDLQLIFNMLFEAGGVIASEGENWIPMCLPGFNKNGYLYMFVSFLDVVDEGEEVQSRAGPALKENRIAVILISANKEGFFELRTMRNDVIEDLEKTGQMNIIKSAVIQGRPTTTDIVPGTVLRHFLYKSRGNLQYVMPSFEPHYLTLFDRRRLLTLYHTLHASVHAKTAHLKVHHCISRESISLAWATPLFELYCVAAPTTTRNALAQSANKVVQWVRREEERVFIIGGAVF